ncbi:MAG: radical SAM family heme chaperone HemW [Candidatus Kapabacteria bacterium]|nr:radical SAM family heme chaperone HemW [Candidatus Kapabacteria bacterium]
MAGIYIHYPYCQKKCFYCDFFSVTDKSSDNKFIAALLKEIENKTVCQREMPPADTIYLGGGTPSLLSVKNLEKVLNKLHNNFNIVSNAEITLEANPGTLTKQKINEFLTLGINRLSIGIQSFNNDELIFLQRIHNAATAKQAINDAIDAGFENISIDLIFSIPNQTKELLKYSLETAVDFPIQHISAYSLIFEPQTPLYDAMEKGEIIPMPEDDDSDLYAYLIEFLGENGFEQYEVSNFARNGNKSKHNLNYWNNGEFYAFGPSAAGYVGGYRYKNFSDIDKYIEYIDNNESPEEYREEITSEKVQQEQIFLPLRAEGISFEIINSVNDEKKNTKAMNFIKELMDHNLMISKDNRFKLTSKGYMICDEITARLMNIIF